MNTHGPLVTDYERRIAKLTAENEALLVRLAEIDNFCRNHLGQHYSLVYEEAGAARCALRAIRLYAANGRKSA